MGRKRKPLIFGDELSIKRAKCSQRLPRSTKVTMIAAVEIATSPTGSFVRSIDPLREDDFYATRREAILPSKPGAKDDDGYFTAWPGATVYERDPIGFAPYTDLVYTDDEPRKFYLIQATY